MDEIKKAADFMINRQGYCDIGMVSILSGVPQMIVENAFKQMDLEETGVKGQYRPTPPTTKK